MQYRWDHFVIISHIIKGLIYKFKELATQYFQLNGCFKVLKIKIQSLKYVLYFLIQWMTTPTDKSKTYNSL